ncbi:MAG: hypothetical protein ABUL71_01745 [Gemmatimonadota bacterium]
MRRWSALIAPSVISACDGFGRGRAPIRLGPLVTLGASTGDGAIATTPTVSALHPNGFRVVIPAHSAIGALPLVYTERGNYRESLRGNGTAAGSFDGAMFTRFGPGDSIHIFDNSGRVLLFSPQLEYVRSIDLADAPTDALVLPDARIVAAARDGALRVIDSVGAVVRVISTASGVLPSGELLIPGARGTFWTSSVVGSWQLQHWDSSGTRLGTMTFKPEWLAASASDRDTKAPHSRIVAVWFDGAGLIWVVAQVPDRKWRDGTATSAGEQVIADDDKYYDSVVEVREGKTGVVLATTRFDKYFRSTAGPGVLVHVIHTGAGWQQAELSRIVWDAVTSRP